MLFSKIETDRAPAAIGPYSQGLKAGEWLFVSGQIGLSPQTGELVGDDFAEQARQAIENMLEIVYAGGGKLFNIVSVDVYLTDIDQFATFNQIYQEYFGEHKPTRAVVGVAALPKGAQVEMKCIVNMKF